MAVINCPACNKKISDKAKICSHCSFEMGEMNEDSLKRIKMEQKIKKQNTLMNHSFIAMLLFCGGFLMLFWQNAQPGSWQYIASVSSSVLGFVLYLVTRIRIILVKRQK